MRTTTLPLILGLCFFGQGCKDDEARKELATMRDGMQKFASQLQERDVEIVTSVKSQREAIIELQNRLAEAGPAMKAMLSLLQLAEKQPNIDLHGRGFTSVKTSSGLTLIVIVDDVQPKLDGVSIKMRIGNPYNMNFGRTIVKLRWSTEYSGEAISSLTGKPDDPDTLKQWTDNYNEFMGSLKSATQQFNTPIRPGSWSEVDLVIAPVSLSQIKYCSIEIDVEEISLMLSTTPQ